MLPNFDRNRDRQRVSTMNARGTLNNGDVVVYLPIEWLVIYTVVRLGWQGIGGNLSPVPTATKPTPFCFWFWFNQSTAALHYEAKNLKKMLIVV